MSKINILQDIFSDATSIFEKESASLDEALTNGIIVLDTNILLLPFNVNKHSLEQIINAYKKLVAEKRLLIPAHVAREFAKNRAKMLGDIYSSIEKMISGQRDIKRYPLLSDMTEYKEIVDLQKSITETEKNIKDRVKAVLGNISRFDRNDPVSISYTEIFDGSTIYQHKISNEDIEKDLKRRNDDKIPPGYKDNGKPVNPEGDLIVWHSILEIGEKLKKDLVFISQDGKPDWQNNVNKKPFQPRYELVYEYRRASGGKSFHIAPLSQLLETLNTPESTVQKIERLEHIRTPSYPTKAVLRTGSLDEKVSEMKNWFLSNYEPPENHLPYESREGGFIYIWGGPYELDHELHTQFGSDISDHLIDICIEEIENEYGDVEWSAVPKNDTLWVSILVDYEKCNDIGAAGMFQVIGVEDENGNSLAKYVNPGQHYSGIEEVLSELSQKLKISVDGELQS